MSFLQNFGIRRGSYHRGIDIPAPFGTNIYAADSGTVAEATYHVSFGNYVLITHENDYATLYAHCSSLLVKPGGYGRKRADDSACRKYGNRRPPSAL